VLRLDMKRTSVGLYLTPGEARDLRFSLGDLLAEARGADVKRACCIIRIVGEGSARTDRLVVGAFVGLAVAPFAYAAAHSWFWQHEHSMAPFATAAYLILLAAFVLGRYRWTWLLFTLTSVAAVAAWPFDAHRFETKALLFMALDVATLAILLSQPMRRRLKRPVELRRTAGARLQG
jgi:hypothetical protein